jgi:hypothetical protein
MSGWLLVAPTGLASGNRSPSHQARGIIPRINADKIKHLAVDAATLAEPA